jgi:release factor glutamine methyltransferase
LIETLGSLLAEAAAALTQAQCGEPRRRARRLVASTLALSPADLLAHPERAVDERATDRVRVVLARMVDCEPLSRILGRREFWGMEFGLSTDTLDPRPETETVVTAVLRSIPDRLAPLRFLDLGTGTGCILLALLSEFPAATGFGVDVAVGAAVTARGNAAALGVARRAHFFVGDWAGSISGVFDVIISNPPYIASAALADLPREVALYDPRCALDGGLDGLCCYRSLAADLRGLMGSRSLFVCEVGLSQGSAVEAILRANGLSIERCERDLAGIMRCVVARPAASTAEKIVGMGCLPG